MSNYVLDTFYPITPPRSRSVSTSASSRSPNSKALSLMDAIHRNRSLSIRSRKTGSSHDDDKPGRHRFTMSSLRGLQQPELSKRLYKLIKSENHAISAYDNAGRERLSIASQLSEWGEATGDDAISEVSDKLGVLLAEIAEQEDYFAQGLEEYRGVLKQIRNTESSVQPSRDHKSKVSDDIAKLKYKEPTSTKIPLLEQELVRAEAQSLVAEAQLTNITRQKLKEAYLIHTAALLERCEKQALLARHARRLVELLDDTAVVPGESHPPFEGHDKAQQIMTEAEEELRAWTASWEQQPSQQHIGSAGLPESQNAPMHTGGNAQDSSAGQMMQSPTTTTNAPQHEEMYAHDEQGSLQPTQSTGGAGAPHAESTAATAGA